MHSTTITNARLISHPAIGAAGLNRLAHVGRVVVAGLGNLGLRMVAGLAPLGMPLDLVDWGHVGPENVGVQPFGLDEVGLRKTDAARRRVLNVNPAARIRCYHQNITQLGPGVFHGAALIVGCLDNMRGRIWLAQLAAFLGIPYIDLALDGSGESLYGRVSGFDTARGTSCLSCGWDDTNWADVHNEQGGAACALLTQRGGGPGNDQTSDSGQNNSEPPATLAFPGLSEMVAGLGVIQVVRFLLGAERQRVLGRELRLDTTTGRFRDVALTRDAKCRLNHEPWQIQSLARPTDEVTVAELLEIAAAAVGNEPVLTAYDDPLVMEAACASCRSSHMLLKFQSSLPPCPDCQGSLIPLNHAIRAGFTRHEVETSKTWTWDDLGMRRGGAMTAAGPRGRTVFLFDDHPSHVESQP